MVDIVNVLLQQTLLTILRKKLFLTRPRLVSFTTI